MLSLRYSCRGAVLEVRGASGLPLGVVQAGGLCALGGWTAPRVQGRAPSAGTGLPCLPFRRLPLRRSASGLALSTLLHLSAAWRPPPVSSRTFSRVLSAECLSVPVKGPESRVLLLLHPSSWLALACSGRRPHACARQLLQLSA